MVCFMFQLLLLLSVVLVPDAVENAFFQPGAVVDAQVCAQE